MIKYAIKSKKDNNDIVIFHALPNEMTKFQWYISEKIDEEGESIENEIYESYQLSMELIKEKQYDGKYLYCKYFNKQLNVYEKTDYILLKSDIDSMIKNGIVFDSVSQFNKDGSIGEL